MTSRSIVLSTAALLLMSTAVPIQFGFTPTVAFAQEVSAEVRAALAADPAQLEARQISEHVRVLRDAIQSGVFKGADRKAAQQKMKALREVLLQLRGERQAAGQDTQEAEQPAQPETGQVQKSERKTERQAEKAERKAERQAEKAQREAEIQAQAEREAEIQAQQSARQAEQAARQAEIQVQQAEQAQQAERKAQRQAQQAEQQAQTQQPAQQPAQQQQQARQAPAAAAPALSDDMIAALRDNRPAEELKPAELRNRIQTLRGIVQSGALSQEQRGQVQARMQADREVLQASRSERKGESTAAQKTEQEPRQAPAAAMPEAEVEQRAQAIIADDTSAEDLDNKALRKRLTENRAILETGQLSKAEMRQLRQQLRRDREELRGRVASRQEETDEPAKPAKPAASGSTTGSSPGSTSSSTSSSTTTTEVNTTTNVNVIIEQRTPSDRLSENELERRVRALNRALKEERLARRDAEIARELVEWDRRELRRRLHDDRERRRERWRAARSRNEVFIDFNIPYRPPQVIFAAEAMPRDIEMQLVAPPARRISRRYTVQEIASSQDVREMMPGIEIDTLNFDFGSAEVRPEEIDKLDAIADVIERIVAARPDEVFLIEGHTDAVGSDAANYVLSQRRSQAVMEALLDYYAIDPENLQTVGLGERYLKIWTEEPEEENRRVTIRRITPLLAGGQG